MSDDKAGFIYTHTGKKFWPLEPRAEDIDIVDIAHSLAMKCRYQGHSALFYSVAQHSVLLSEYVAPEHAMWALLHDAEEAYSPFGDIPRPVKEVLREEAPMVLDINDRIQARVCERFGLDPVEPREVKEADRNILGDEMTLLMEKTDGYDAVERFGSLGIRIHPWQWHEAKNLFLARFYTLGGVR